MSNVQKYNFRLISDPVSLSSSTQQVVYADYYLPLHLSLTTKNIGHYQYVSQELNERIPLITGQTSGFTLFDSGFQLPPEPTLNSTQQTSTLITGITNSELITSIKGYSSTAPYVIGTKIINGTTINIQEVTENYVKYVIDLIEYKTYFNANTYSSIFTSNSPQLDNRFQFNTIQTEDNYTLNIHLVNNSSTTVFYVFKNNQPLIPCSILGGKSTYGTKLSLVTNDFLEILISGTTTSTSLEYSLVPEEVDSEERYTTVYSFGAPTLNANNSLSTGFIYKSDVQPYDEKPIVYNKINVERNGMSVYDSIFKLGSIGNVNDFEEFFIV